jgi:hypothetical protein
MALSLTFEETPDYELMQGMFMSVDSDTEDMGM